MKKAFLLVSTIGILISTTFLISCKDVLVTEETVPAPLYQSEIPDNLAQGDITMGSYITVKDSMFFINISIAQARDLGVTDETYYRTKKFIDQMNSQLAQDKAEGLDIILPSEEGFCFTRFISDKDEPLLNDLETWERRWSGKTNRETSASYRGYHVTTCHLYAADIAYYVKITDRSTGESKTAYGYLGSLNQEITFKHGTSDSNGFTNWNFTIEATSARGNPINITFGDNIPK